MTMLKSRNNSQNLQTSCHSDSQYDICQNFITDSFTKLLPRLTFLPVNKRLLFMYMAFYLNSLIALDLNRTLDIRPIINNTDSNVQFGCILLLCSNSKMISIQMHN
jgi:hypothetical protein